MEVDSLRNKRHTGRYSQFLSSLNCFNRVAESHPKEHTLKLIHSSQNTRAFPSNAYTIYHAQSVPLHL